VDLCLSPEQLANLTGRKQPKRQIEWLSANGWKFFVGGDGLPKVDREYYREMVGVKTITRRRGPKLEGLARGAT
jgi:hypothetical protein